MPIDTKFIPFKTCPRPLAINHYCNCASYYEVAESRRVTVVLDPGIKYACVPYQTFASSEWRDGKDHPWEGIEWHDWEGGPLTNEYGAISL